jgi:hypothetical protein
MDAQRRRLLATLAAIGSGGLAGCAAGIPEPTGDGEGQSQDSQAAARDAASTATVEEDTTVTQAETTATTDEAQAEIDAAKQQLRAAGVEGDSLSELITELRRDRDGWQLLAGEATKDIEGLVDELYHVADERYATAVERTATLETHRKNRRWLNAAESAAEARGAFDTASALTWVVSRYSLEHDGATRFQPGPRWSDAAEACFPWLEWTRKRAWLAAKHTTRRHEFRAREAVVSESDWPSESAVEFNYAANGVDGG